MKKTYWSWEIKFKQTIKIKEAILKSINISKSVAEFILIKNLVKVSDSDYDVKKN